MVRFAGFQGGADLLVVVPVAAVEVRFHGRLRKKSRISARTLDMTVSSAGFRPVPRWCGGNAGWWVDDALHDAAIVTERATATTSG